MTIAAVTKRSGVLFHQLEPGSGGMAVAFTALLHALIALVGLSLITIVTLIIEGLSGGGDERLIWTMLLAMVLGLPTIVVSALVGYSLWAVVHHRAVSVLGGQANLVASLRTTSYASAIGWLWAIVPFVMLVPLAGWVLGACAMIFHVLFITFALISLGVGRLGMRPGPARVAAFVPVALYLLLCLAYFLLVWKFGPTPVDSPDVYY